MSFERSWTRPLLSAAILAVALTVGLGAEGVSAEVGEPPSSAVPPAANDDASAGAHLVAPDDLGTDEFATLGAASHELWSVDPDAAGKCLDVYNWGVGPWIQMWGCHGGGNQDWWIEGTGHGTSTIRNLWSGGKCLDAAWGRGAQLRQWTCDNTITQEWIPHYFADGDAFESAYLPGQCIDIRDWGTSNIVQLWDCHWGTNQRWQWEYIPR